MKDQYPLGAYIKQETTMIKKLVLAFAVIFLLSPLATVQARAYNDYDFRNTSFMIEQIYNSSRMLFRTDLIAIKKNGQYDESKDPALRRGTENWEQPQGSFWIIPAVVVGLVFIVLFFNRE
jgi:hypothetical protein